jgi:hypothetical protein
MSRAARHGSHLRKSAVLRRSQLSSSTSLSWVSEDDESQIRATDVSHGSESQIRVGALAGGTVQKIGRLLAISEPWSAAWCVSSRRSAPLSHT